MTLKKIQYYLSIVFFTTLVFTQALVFVGVKAANNNLLQAIFIEPIGENIDIGENIYFQAMLSNGEDITFDFVYFNLQNLDTGLNENYQASLESDGTWLAQSAWDTDKYLIGSYYLSVTAYVYKDGIPSNIYSSEHKFINLIGDVSIAQLTGTTANITYFSSPVANANIDPIVDPSLNINFHIEENISNNNVGGVQFTLTRLQDGNTQIPLVFQAEVSSIVSPGYVVWTNSGTIDLASIETGNYSITTNITSNIAMTDLTNIDPVYFVIQKTSLASNSSNTIVDPTSVSIIEPINASIITNDQIQIAVIPDQDLQDGQSIEAKFIYRGTDVSIEDKSFLLSRVVGDILSYEDLITLPSAITVDSGSIDTNNLWPNGNYIISFELLGSEGSANVVLGQVNISLDRISATTEITDEITLNNLVAGSIITGDSLDLNFTTNFSSNIFRYSVVKENNLAMGVDGTIPLIGDGKIWQQNLSAGNKGLINGIYILSATATKNDGSSIEFGPITFEWRVSEEDTTIQPENASLQVYQPSSGQIGPGDILIASSNVLGVKFVLLGIESDLSYELDKASVDCANEAILNQEIRDQVVAAGHKYCFYSVLSNDNSENISNNNYYYFIQHYIDNIFQKTSNEVLVSYFKEGSKTEPITSNGAKFVFFGLSAQTSISGDFNILVGSDLDLPTGLEVKAKKVDSERSFSFIADKVSWRDMELFGVLQENEPDIPFVYITELIDSSLLEDGVYDLTVFGRSEQGNQIIVANNAEIDIDATDDSLGTTNIEGDTGVVDTEAERTSEKDNDTDIIDREKKVEVVDDSLGSNTFIKQEYNLSIDYYSTCSDQGIEDQETCKWFRATMNLLDVNCIDQGIYDALACEDYLYRINTDLECQENNIIDREECKNYLLEKYSGQVDCQLEDASLCNSILKDKQLNRLVSGQKLSQSIKRAVDPLLGESISIQDLSDALEGAGVDSEEILPLVTNSDIRILVARAQQETVLEEKNKLTIINQAVIILDTDGDGLSDDLEEYYGTDVNNPDTDGDGFVDGEEIKNGYDPMGTGELTIERIAFDKVTLNEGKIIEQPKEKSKKIDKRMEVASVESGDDELKLQGKAEANTWVNIYLYSGLPLVMTTKTDASGNWSYDIKNSLTDGHHRVFVTINDDTGKIVKQSRPISFLIREAKAVTVDNYFDDSFGATSTNNPFIYYVLGGIFLVFLALGAIIFMHKGKNRNLEI